MLKNTFSTVASRSCRKRSQDALTVAATQRSAAALGPASSRGVRLTAARFATPAIVASQGLRSDTAHRCTRSGWKARASLQAKQPAETIVAGRAMRQVDDLGQLGRVDRPEVGDSTMT